MEAPVPDINNYDMPDQPIPDNFLDDTLSKAITQHRRKESQIQSVQDDFSKVLSDENVAQNIAANLIGYIHDDDPNHQSRETPIDPDENDARTADDDDETAAINYGLDEVLTETVTQHKHRESRTDFLQQKLHEMFPQEEDGDAVMDMTGGVTAGGGMGLGSGGGGKIDMSQIASNLVAFLHDDTSKPQTPQYPPEEIHLAQSQYADAANNGSNQSTKKHKARGSTDLTDLQEEIDRLQTRVNTLESALKTKDDKNNELNERIKELENKNKFLLDQIQYLQNSKIELAENSTKCIDDLRGLLIQYQRKLNLTCD